MSKCRGMTENNNNNNNKRVVSLRHPEVGCDNEPKQLNELKHKTSRVLLRFLSRFCLVDLKAPVEEEEDRGGGGHETTSCEIKPPRTPNNISRSLLSRWPQLVLLLYVVCSFRLLVALYLQYVYDYHLLRLQTFDQSGESAQVGVFLGQSNKLLNESQYLRGNLTQIRESLLQNVAHHRSNLKAWGAPFIKAPVFTLQAPMLLLLMLAYLPYIQLGLMFNYFKWVNLFFINIMLNEKEERIKVQEMIDKQIDCIKSSSLNYLDYNYCLMLQIEQPDGGVDVMMMRRNKSPAPFEETRKVGLLQQLIEEHEETVAILDKLNTLGQLQPINRTPQWIDKMCTDFNNASIGNLIYSFFFDTAILFWIPIYYIHFEYETQPMDLLFVVEICILTEISVIATDFYVALYVCNATDQTRLLTETINQLNECIVLNEQLECYYANNWEKVSNEQRVKLISEMNSNLLLAVMRYKLMLAQYQPIRKTFVVAAFTGFANMLVMPTLTRLHLPYLTGSLHLVGMYFNIVLMIFADFSFVPLAQFHSEAMKVYKTLWNLAAHVADVDQRSSSSSSSSSSSGGAAGPSYSASYLQHTRWMILKELSHPEELSDQFATQCFGMQITYPNLVRIHYWYSMIVISAYAEIQSLKEIFGERLNDPFGLRQHN